MPYALLATLWISAVLVFGVVVSGLGFFHAGSRPHFHLVLALVGVAVALAAHAMVFLFLTRFVQRVREWIVGWEVSLRDDLWVRAAGVRRKVLPGILIVSTGLLAVLLLGTAVAGGRVTKPPHEYAAYAVLIYHLHMVLKETLQIFKSLSLVEEVHDIARRRSDSADSPSIA